MADEMRVTSTAECASCDWTHTVTGGALDDVGQKAERALKEHDETAHQTAYVLLCRVCGGDNPIPFPNPEERGRWAAEHTAGTGHDRWWSKDVR